MVTVRLFGTLRLDMKRRSLTVEGTTVAEMLTQTAAALGMDPRTLADQVVVFVNGEQRGPRHRLQDGDEIYLLSPAAGG